METAPSKAVVVRAEGLSLDPNTDVKSGLGNVPIIPVLVRSGRRSPAFVHSQSGQLVSCKFSKSSYLERKQGRELLWKSPELVSGLYVCIHTSTAHQHVPTPPQCGSPPPMLVSGLYVHTLKYTSHQHAPTPAV